MPSSVIRLQANDDVLIATAQLLPGTSLLEVWWCAT